MCMNSEYMLLMLVILGPNNSKCLIDVYLELLIEDLQNLWHVGALTHDCAKNKTFPMRAALMWTVNDLPTFGMASGWSSAGVIGLTGEKIYQYVEELSVEVSLSLPDGYGSEQVEDVKLIVFCI
ncbi:UNVERIFIED_CONTAM: hypothetical protein Sindi_1655100 [Sesamum indicum]